MPEIKHGTTKFDSFTRLRFKIEREESIIENLRLRMHADESIHSSIEHPGAAMEKKMPKILQRTRHPLL